MDELTRTQADRRTTEIEQMIARENDESKRANLVALNSINNNLIANTELAHSLCDRMEHQELAFTDHVQKGDHLFYFGKGIWTVLSAVLIVVQGIIGWGLIRLTDQLESLHAVDVSAAAEMAAMRGEIRLMKGDKGDPGPRGETGAKGSGFWGDRK